MSDSNDTPPIQQNVAVGYWGANENPKVNHIISHIRNIGYEFIVLPVSRSSFSRVLFESTPEDEETKQVFLRNMEEWRAGIPFSREELCLQSAESLEVAVGLTSPWIDLDSTDSRIRTNSEIALRQEFAWAIYLGIGTVMIHPPKSEFCNYARTVWSIINGTGHPSVWMQLPLTLDSDEPRKKETGSWEQWTKFRTLCSHDTRLGIALYITADLPSEKVLERWIAEPVRAVIIPTDIFLINAKGYPVLSKKHQSLVRSFLKLGVNFVIRDSKTDREENDSTVDIYMQYIRYMNRSGPELNEREKFATGYQDYLQSPLQPLMDNLEYSIYETFEKDRVKYILYEQAVHRALLDRVPSDSDEITVIVVAGAGRGPLVTRSLKAAEKANRKVRVYAVEKNPNAFVTLVNTISLQNMKAQVWDDNVTIAFSDIRRWNAPEKADILVSELLGSFGDNELSPECLDGAQKFLKPDGISIPSSYTAFIAPLSSAKLFAEAAMHRDWEMPYVVMFHACTQLASPKSVWTFEHPNRLLTVDEQGNPITNYHNVRYSKVTFDLAENGILHGFAGYFDCVLYKDIKMSIHPERHSTGMFSWFPIFFPLKEPIHLPRETCIEAHFWRLTSQSKVWYEWAVDCSISTIHENVPVNVSVIHNPNGRSYWIGC
ncbi:6266_t:CDS:10 [Paraglomus brasilianum]|uniref:Protein arginine N-methyltransferase n=1 Tax=Paraglomus brasilianum TaxID=144538 RepID=A0A9N8Z3S2_9GLOM|nr:6266_t:CDS:10 [Paraglomus brasilianum]